MLDSIGIVSMGEAGNYGDDLILVRMVNAIYSVNGSATVDFLSHGVPIDWAALRSRLGWRGTPNARSLRFEVPGSRSNQRAFMGSDLVLFGGGGLLQNSHSLHEPYHWLSHLPSGDKRPPIVAVGLGLGPFDEHWSRRLGSSSPFDASYLRDASSLDMARGFGWRALQCEDFVRGDVREWLGARSQPSGSLGLALRAWPGLGARAVADLVEEVAGRRGITRVVGYVLEDKPWDSTDSEFTKEVLEFLPKYLASDLAVYRAGDVTGFTDRLLEADIAISMKLHSSIVWGGAGVEVIPIVYAPKVASLFGLPYDGLRIYRDSNQLLPERAPSANSIVEDLVAERIHVQAGSSKSYFDLRERACYRGMRLMRGAGRRLKMVGKGGAR